MKQERLSNAEEIMLSRLRNQCYFPNWSLFLRQMKMEARHRDAFAALILSYEGDGKTYGTVYPFDANTVVNVLPLYWSKQPKGLSTLRAVVNVGSDHLGLYWSEFVLITCRGGFLRTHILPKGELAQEVFLTKYLPLLEGAKQ